MKHKDKILLWYYLFLVQFGFALENISYLSCTTSWQCLSRFSFPHFSWLQLLAFHGPQDLQYLGWPPKVPICFHLVLFNANQSQAHQDDLPLYVADNHGRSLLVSGLIIAPAPPFSTPSLFSQEQPILIGCEMRGCEISWGTNQKGTEGGSYNRRLATP